MSARNVIDQRDHPGAAVHYAAVDKDAIIVAAAGDGSKKDCAEPDLIPLQPDDPRAWNAAHHGGDTRGSTTTS